MAKGEQGFFRKIKDWFKKREPLGSDVSKPSIELHEHTESDVSKLPRKPVQDTKPVERKNLR
ncbi:MAG: hypothetical protein V1855_04155 [bacterium]